MERNGPAWLSRDPVWGTGLDLDAGRSDWGAYGVPRANGWLGERGHGPGTWGGTTSRQLNSQGILAAVTRATNLIVGPVTQTSWRYFKYDTSRGIPQASEYRPDVQIQPYPLFLSDPMLNSRTPGAGADRPLLPAARRLNANEFWSSLLTAAVWWGRGACMWIESSVGTPLAGTMRLISPWGLDIDDEGRWVLDPEGDDPLVSDFDGGFDIGPHRWRVSVMRGLPPNDDRTPEGSLSRIGYALRTGARIASYTENVTRTGVPAGVLKVNTPNFDEDDAIRLRRHFLDAHGGDKRSIAVLNAGVDFSAISFNPSEMDLTTQRLGNLTDIAHAFGLSASWLDASLGGSSLTYSNLADRRLDAYSNTLAPWAAQMQQMLSTMTPYGSAIMIDFTEWLQGGQREGLEYVTAGLRDGWLSVQEARSHLRLPPIPTNDLAASKEAPSNVNQ